jgi:hypothetical protein
MHRIRAVAVMTNPVFGFSPGRGAAEEFIDVQSKKRFITKVSSKRGASPGNGRAITPEQSP